ncbi:hypothetical protein [Actinoplanes globisporus]|uniref:hypothetical protein n=1 Tax=Paractinoplanes globisporus TaxID=113565 RepID=UPI00036803E5
MDDKERDQIEWADWAARLESGRSEDFSQVFAHVRPDAADRAEWTQDWRTRAFAGLALHLLYRKTIGYRGDRPIIQASEPCSDNWGRDLERHAKRVIADREQTAALTEQRWNETWSSADDFLSDCFAYLFRPEPYERRIRDVQKRLFEIMRTEPPLGAFVREGVALEIKSLLADPLAALQTAVQATFPNRRDVRQYLERLDGNPIKRWASLYAFVFPLYGLKLRPGTEWFDVAYIFTTVADGVLLRTRSHDRWERLTGGSDVFSTVILGMLPDLFVVDRESVDGLPILELPKGPIRGLDDGEADDH